MCAPYCIFQTKIASSGAAGPFFHSLTRLSEVTPSPRQKHKHVTTLSCKHTDTTHQHMPDYSAITPVSIETVTFSPIKQHHWERTSRDSAIYKIKNMDISWVSNQRVTERKL